MFSSGPCQSPDLCISSDLRNSHCSDLCLPLWFGYTLSQECLSLPILSHFPFIVLICSLGNSSTWSFSPYVDGTWSSASVSFQLARHSTALEVLIFRASHSCFMDNTNPHLYWGFIDHCFCFISLSSPSCSVHPSPHIPDYQFLLIWSIIC